MQDRGDAYSDKGEGYFSNTRQEMLSFIPVDAHLILDIGCGDGSFGALLKRTRDVEVTGVEAFPDAAERAREVLDQVFGCNVEVDDLELPQGYFDCIIYNDVLEHLRDPWITVSRLSCFLRPGGYVVSSIPNVRYFDVFKDLLVSKEWVYQDEGVLDRTHLRFFTEKSIPRMFDETGYEVLQLQGIHGRRFPWKFALLNLISGGRFDDVAYQRFACVARLRAP